MIIIKAVLITFVLVLYGIANILSKQFLNCAIDHYRTLCDLFHDNNERIIEQNQNISRELINRNKDYEKVLLENIKLKDKVKKLEKEKNERKSRL